MCQRPWADPAVSWCCELIGSCRLNSLWCLALWGDFTHCFLSMHFCPLWPAIFWYLFLHPDLQSHMDKGTSRTFFSGSVGLLEIALATPRVCFSINTNYSICRTQRCCLRTAWCDAGVLLHRREQISAKHWSAAGSRGSSCQRQWQLLTERRVWCCQSYKTMISLIWCICWCCWSAPFIGSWVSQLKQKC